MAVNSSLPCCFNELIQTVTLISEFFTTSLYLYETWNIIHCQQLTQQGKENMNQKAHRGLVHHRCNTQTQRKGSNQTAFSNLSTTFTHHNQSLRARRRSLSTLAPLLRYPEGRTIVAQAQGAPSRPPGFRAVQQLLRFCVPGLARGLVGLGAGLWSLLVLDLLLVFCGFVELVVFPSVFWGGWLLVWGLFGLV